MIDSMYPAGCSDSDDHFSLSSVGDGDHECEGADCEGCYDLWLAEVAREGKLRKSRKEALEIAERSHGQESEPKIAPTDR